MQLIIISKKSGAHHHWHVNKAFLGLFVILLLVGLAASAMVTYRVMEAPMRSMGVMSKALPLPEGMPIASMSATDQGPTELTDYYAKRIGVLQAEAIRLKSLMTQLAEAANLDTAPFLLSEPPGQGGMNEEGNWLSPINFMTELDALESSFQQQDEKIIAMQSFNMMNEQLQSTIPAGSPTQSGYISSNYGNRIHPISGKSAFHKGIDFAAPSGSDVLAAADGLVVKSERHSGYGILVELEHGNGYVTRYAHNKSSTVKVGDRVKQGQEIALVGSTGNSTGPHVHFEILQDGESIDPHSYLNE